MVAEGRIARKIGLAGWNEPIAIGDVVNIADRIATTGDKGGDQQRRGRSRKNGSAD